MTTVESSKPLVAAFDVGQCLNELRWHLVQTCICLNREEAAAAISVLERLEVSAVRLFPTEGGGDVRKETQRWRDRWVDWLGAESFGEFAQEVWTRLGEDYISPTEAAKQLASQVPPIESEIDVAIRTRLASFPSMQLAMQLGRCIDEGQHVPWPGYELITVERNPKWQQVKRFSPNAIPKAITFTATSQGQLPPARLWRGRRWRAAELRPAPNWRRMVRALWQKAVPVRECPQIVDAHLSTESRRLRLVRWLIIKARLALSEADCPGWEPADQSSDWPPNMGWHFRNGEFAFDGRKYCLSGQPLKLLRAVALANRPPTRAELIKEIWMDDERVLDDGNKAFRRVKFNLNRELKALFKDDPCVPQLVESGKGADALSSVSWADIKIAD